MIKIDPAILERMPESVRKMLQGTRAAPIPNSFPTDVRSHMPLSITQKVDWDQPWWVAIFWVPPENAKGDLNGIRWTPPTPESNMLASLFPGISEKERPTVEWVNENKDRVTINPHNWPEGTQFLGLYGPDTPEFERAYQWATKARAMQESKFRLPSGAE